jgi:aminomethyltransferase
MPRPTPFHERTNAACTSQSWAEWSGYLSANTYELEHIHEYHAVRTGCAVFDVSPLFKYHVRGVDAGALLDRVTTRDVSKCRVGQVQYTAWCDDRGKIIDDGTLARFADDAFRLTAAMPTLDWLQDNALGFDAEIEDVSEAYGALALQGPTSRDLLQQIAGTDLSGLGYFRMVDDKIAGVPVRISRTGYTGDLGFEVFVRAEDAVPLWDAVMEVALAHQARPAGSQALEMARIEAGLLLIDVDFHSARRTIFDVQRSSPYELGLDWLVKLDKRHFVGQEALRREKAEGVKERTVGLVLDLDAIEEAYASVGMPLHLPYLAWNEEIPIYSDGERRQHVGKATCGTWSPLLKKYVAIARVQSALAEPQRHLFIEQTIEGRRFAIPATVTPMPFFDPPRKRAMGGSA